MNLKQPGHGIQVVQIMVPPSFKLEIKLVDEIIQSKYLGGDETPAHLAGQMAAEIVAGTVFGKNNYIGGKISPFAHQPVGDNRQQIIGGFKQNKAHR